MPKPSRQPPPSWNADPRGLWGIDAGAFLLGSLILLLTSRLGILISLPFAIAVIAIMAAVFALEIGLWYARGIRRIRVEDDALFLEGRKGTPERSIPASEIARVRLTRRLGGGRILIELRARGPAWKRLLPPFMRGRIAIRSELFSRADFDSLRREISRLASRKISLV